MGFAVLGSLGRPAKQSTPTQKAMAFDNSSLHIYMDKSTDKETSKQTKTSQPKKATKRRRGSQHKPSSPITATLLPRARLPMGGGATGSHALIVAILQRAASGVLGVGSIQRMASRA